MAIIQPYISSICLIAIGDFTKFLYFSLLAGNLVGERFASDSIHRQLTK
jgi:hypothetical protein